MYLGSIGGISLLITAGLLYYTHLTGGSILQFLLTGLLGFGIALEAATNLVNWIITHTFPPRTLPRMDFSEGIPTGFRTMVVVPSLLGNIVELEALLEELELHYLSNPDPLLTFALLTDLPDAKQALMPEDEQLIEKAKIGVEQLNHKYEKSAPFYLFHRKREWNPAEGVWMGWERKRGKLNEFNRLLMNHEDTSFSYPGRGSQHSSADQICYHFGCRYFLTSRKCHAG